jgi:hypothetical protein
MISIITDEEETEQQGIENRITILDNSNMLEITFEKTEMKTQAPRYLRQLILETVILQIGPRTEIGDNNSTVIMTGETMAIGRMNTTEENHSKEGEEVEDSIITIEKGEICPEVHHDLTNALKIVTMKRLQHRNNHQDSKGTLQMIHNQ